MPEITAMHVALPILTALIGGGIAWALRGKRSGQEKAAINAGWQEQMEAQRTEHQRLGDQNKSLMDQISQFQASNQDAKNRVRNWRRRFRRPIPGVTTYSRDQGMCVAIWSWF